MPTILYTVHYAFGLEATESHTSKYLLSTFQEHTVSCHKFPLRITHVIELPHDVSSRHLTNRDKTNRLPAEWTMWNVVERRIMYVERFRKVFNIHHLRMRSDGGENWVDIVPSGTNLVDRLYIIKCCHAVSICGGCDF